jgi:hypothetical protein
MSELEDKLGVIPLTFVDSADKLKGLLQDKALISLVKNNNLDPLISALQGMGLISGIVSTILSDLTPAQKDMIQEFSQVNKGRSLAIKLLSTPTLPIIIEITELPGLLRIHTLSEEEVESQKLPLVGIDVDTLFSFIVSIISERSLSIPEAVQRFIVQDNLTLKRGGKLIRLVVVFLKLPYPELRDLVGKVVARIAPLAGTLPGLLGQPPKG